MLVPPDKKNISKDLARTKKYVKSLGVFGRFFLGGGLGAGFYVMFWLEREDSKSIQEKASTVEVGKTTDLFLSILEAI